jgi:ribosomal protein L9
MQIILQEDIEKLGQRGDVVTVKPGGSERRELEGH